MAGGVRAGGGAWWCDKLTTRARGVKIAWTTATRQPTRHDGLRGGRGAASRGIRKGESQTGTRAAVGVRVWGLSLVSFGSFRARAAPGFGREGIKGSPISRGSRLVGV
jgi:hypothetical protein